MITGGAGMIGSTIARFWRSISRFLHGDLAGEESAMKWIKGLRPEIMIGWFEDGLGVKRVYDPAAKEWVDA